MSSFVGDLTLKLAAALVKAGVFATVVYGAEGFGRETETGPFVHLERVGLVDTYDFSDTAGQPDPTGPAGATRFNKWTSVIVHFAGMSSKSGATDDDHQEAVEGLVDSFILQLQQLVATYRLRLRSMSGGFVTPPNTTDAEAALVGAYYDFTFQIARGIVEKPARMAAATLVPKQSMIVSDQNDTKLHSGAVASITNVASVVTLSGCTGLDATCIGLMVTVSGAASATNNGQFRIVQFNDATSVGITNPSAVTPDANNGAIAWEVDRSEIAVPGV